MKDTSSKQYIILIVFICICIIIILLVLNDRHLLLLRFLLRDDVGGSVDIVVVSIGHHSLIIFGCWIFPFSFFYIENTLLYLVYCTLGYGWRRFNNDLHLLLIRSSTVVLLDRMDLNNVVVGIGKT